MLDFKALWQEAQSFDQFVAEAQKQKELWEGTYRLVRLPDWSLRPRGLRSPRHLLVLAEDWCADTASTIPTLARWAHVTPGLDLRILKRDTYPQVMDQYLTNGTRSIPVVLVLDEDYREIGKWGPYPAELGAWVKDHKPPVLPKDEFVKGKRVWYARDRGETTLREVMAAMGMERVAEVA